MLIAAASQLPAVSSALETLLKGPERPWAVAGLVFCALVFLTIVVARILILIRAFSASIVWGLVALFVPFGVLAFICTHWQDVKKPFLIQLGCVAICVAGVVFFAMNGDRIRQQIAAAAPTPKPTPREVRDLAENETPFPTTVDANAAPRATYIKHAKELTVLYQQLNAERPKLKPGTPAMAAFNVKAAKYQQELQKVTDEKARLDALDHAANLNTDAAMALATLQATAASGDYETFAGTLKKALAEYRQTPSFAGIVALARTTLPQATPDKISAGLRAKATRTAQADFDKTTRQVQGIVNQVPPVVTKPDGAESYHYGYHAGANKPDYNTNNLISTRELWKGEYANLDDAPGVYYRSADCEFNPQTKFFYTSRSVPKKKLSDAEYAELTRLYHLLGQQEKAIADAAPPAGAEERVSADLATLKSQLDGYAMK